ncbi:T9SS type A sorting domain-containing protein [Saccharicrinis sp. FJH62]|uniref:T9SS type A sorting domain-containing protein n=1 Tax=Saccharicrinis sp. FJH62 TaxID=3344657 RepID=UPI0035D49789
MRLLRKTLVGAGILLFSVSSVAQDLLAFPSAEGYGKYAKGARAAGLRTSYGIVVQVTNLEDDVDNPPEGSFRWALKQGIEDITVNGQVLENFQRPLYVVFRVGGVINLKGELRVDRSYMTIAGETAPGDGICFRGATLNFSGSENVIVRYIRSRPGDELGEETSAFRIENGGNFIIDHCSFSWAIEETTHFSSNDNTTVQWCIISESLYNSIHKKGARGYGTQWGGEYASYHHNLLAHHNSRMPRINGSNKNDVYALVDYRDNVNFNWGSSGAFYGGEWEGTPSCSGYSHVNVVNNYFKPGPATSGTTIAAPSLNRADVPLCGYAKWYVNGNYMSGNQSVTDNNWQGISFSPKDSIISDIEHVKSDGTLEDYNDYTQTAQETYVSVLDNVGATLPKRDPIDDRVIKEVKGEIGIVRYEYTVNDQLTPIKGVNSGLIDTQHNLVPNDAPEGTTAWDVYQETPADEAPADRDKDGMPDAWEEANGLNPDNGEDFRDITESGYSNLELYLFSLTGEEVKTSTTNITSKPVFNVYPNPVDDKFRVSCSESISNLWLFDATGRAVMSLNDGYNENSEITVHLNSGCYIVKAATQTGDVLVSKLIKK